MANELVVKRFSAISVNAHGLDTMQMSAAEMIATILPGTVYF